MDKIDVRRHSFDSVDMAESCRALQGRFTVRAALTPGVIHTQTPEFVQFALEQPE